MTSTDRKEVKEMLLDIMSGPLEKINGQYRVVVNQLANIEIQTTKTNGTVKDHEKLIRDGLPHTTANCAQKDVIQEIRDDMVGWKAIRKIVIVCIASTSGVMTILFILYKLFWEKYL